MRNKITLIPPFWKRYPFLCLIGQRSTLKTRVSLDLTSPTGSDKFIMLPADFNWRQIRVWCYDTGNLDQVSDEDGRTKGYRICMNAFELKTEPLSAGISPSRLISPQVILRYETDSP